MTISDLVTHIIQHSDTFPDVGEITLDTAQIIVNNLADDPRIPAVTPEEFLTLWNRLVHDPSVIDID